MPMGWKTKNRGKLKYVGKRSIVNVYCMLSDAEEIALNRAV
jgi:hypothetical protein